MAWIDVPQAPGAARARAVTAKAGESRSWYRITNQAADEAEILLYDEVGGWLGATADDFIADLRGITASSILLRVNSPGGSVTEGIAIANALRSHPANVTVQVDGIAASIASVIAMAGDRVRMMPNALLMVHEASGICAGDSAEMIKMAEVLDKISGNIADAYAVKAGGTRDDWRQVMKDETWYTAEEAVKAGLADEMVSARKQQAESEPDAPEMAARFDLAAYGYHGPAQPEAPKPGPPPMKAQTGEPAPPIALTISLGEALGEQLVTAVRAAVTPSVSAEPVGTGRQAEANAAGPEPSPLDAGLAAPNDPEPTPWAAAFAPLTTPQPDPWAAAFAPLTTGPASSSATES